MTAKTFARKIECEEDGLYFNRYFFKQRFDTKMLISGHHHAMQAALDRTMLPPSHPDFISRLIINVPPGYTKCCPPGTLVKTKRGFTRMGELRAGDTVTSYLDGSAVERKVLATETFTKQCVTAITRGGRRLKVSHDHPVLTHRGWVKAKDLTNEHYLKRLCAAIDGEDPVPDAELDFVTLMLFEGGCSAPSNPRFTSADHLVVKVLKDACSALGIGVKQYASAQPIDYNIMGGASGAAGQLLKEYGLSGKLAKDKTLPAQFFNLPLRQKYRFLSLMIATDGFIIKRTGQLGLTLASESLVNDISLMLDSCGVPSSQYFQGNKHAGAWSLIIPTCHAKGLAGKVDFLQKQAKFEESLKLPVASSLVFGYPYDVVKGLTGRCKASRPRISIKRKGNMITDYQFSRLLTEIDPTLSRWAMEDFVYDRIASVERSGESTVVHLSVDALEYDDKNYIANGLVVHNTEMASISYMARGMAISARARFLHLSYSHKLALTNSATIRSIVKSKNFQAMWPIATKNDVDSKEIWHTTAGGGVTATSAGGQVTGFRAGHMDDEQFSGALIIDDPVKPDDAYSEVVREGVNTNYNETIASRVAVETVPIIVIMQRIHWHDLAGYLLTGGSGEKWHHLDLSVVIDNSKPYPEEYTHGIPIDHGLPDGWLWPFKHNEKHEVALKAHRRRFWAQYMQRPIKRDEETALWTEKTIAKARELNFTLPVRTIVSVDPATTNNVNSDEHGIGVASIYGAPNQYSVDADYTIKGSPKQWAERAIMAYDKHDADAIIIETNQGGDMCEDTLRNAGFTGRVIRVHASKGKVIRAEPIAALYELGYVQHKTGLSDAEEEMLDFDPLTGKSNGKSPNRVDWIVWALTELSGGEASLEELLKMAMGSA